MFVEFLGDLLEELYHDVVELCVRYCDHVFVRGWFVVGYDCYLLSGLLVY